MRSPVFSFETSRGVLRYYAVQLRRVLRGRARAAGLALAVTFHAASHGAIALVAGAMAVALGKTWVGNLRSTPADDASFPRLALMLCSVGLGVLVVKTLAGTYATYVQARVAAEVASGLRLALLDALLARHRLRRPRHGDHAEPPTVAAIPAVAVASLTDRIREIEVGLEVGLLGGLRAGAQLAPLGAVLVYLSPRMAAVAAVLLVSFGMLLGRVRGDYKRASIRAGQERAALLEAADEAVRHADLWVTFGAEAKARARVAGLGDALARGGAALQARAAIISGSNEVLGAAALLGAIAVAHAGWMGSADGPTLLAFAVAFFLAYRPLRELTEARLALARAEGAYGEVQVALAPAPGPAPTPRHEPTDWRFDSLELRGLVLARGVCPPLSVCVPSGSVVAIVGPTGIGKTTLLRTLLGLDRAAAGDVFYGGRPLGDAPAGPTSRPFAWVPQDAPLLADTLEGNVRLGADGVDPTDPLESLGAGALAVELGRARLGAGGRSVSGGERQWIALARAIATRQPVLLLDEPTSGLDDDSQRRVLDAIGRLRGHRTVLMVTHRREPLAVADMVVRLEAA